MTMSTATKPKIIGALQVPSNSSLWVSIDGGSTWGEIDLSAAATTRGRSSYLVLDDNSTEDLLDFLADEINTEIASLGGVGLWSFSLSTDGSQGQGGIVVTTNGEATAVELGYTDPTMGGSTATSTWVQDWLRLDEAGTDSQTFTAGSTTYGYRSHAFGVYPTYLAFEDLDETMVRGSQAVPDEGTPFSLKLAERTMHKLGIRLGQALPRSSSWNEWFQMLDWMSFASQGLVFRHYPRVTVTAAYDAVNEPYGYREYVLARESWDWKPDPAYGNWYKQFKTTLRLHTATSS